MARVVYRRKALSDLETIATYISQSDLERALSYVTEIETACQLWADCPLAGRDRSDIRPDLRSFPHGNYIVFYRPRADGLTVVRVLHAKRDARRLFE